MIINNEDYTLRFINENNDIFNNLSQKLSESYANNLNKEDTIFKQSLTIDTLLTFEEEKYLILKFNLLKTSVLIDLLLYNNNYNFFISTLENISINHNKNVKKDFAEDEIGESFANDEIDEDFANDEIDEDFAEDEIDEDFLEDIQDNEIKKCFFMTYSENKKNNKKIPIEVKKNMILKDINLFKNNFKELKHKIVEQTLTYEEYIEFLENNTKIVNNLNPTIYFFNKLYDNLVNMNDDNEFKPYIKVYTVKKNLKVLKQYMDILVNFNTRLVISIVRKYKSKVPNHISFDDLYHEGIIGLIKSVYRFSPYANNKLSTYSTWLIRQHVIQSINNSKNFISTPIYYSKIIGDYSKIKKEFEEKKIDFTDKDICEKMGISLKKLKSAKKYISNRSYFYFNQTNNENNEEYNIEDRISAEINPVNIVEKKLMDDEEEKILREVIEKLNPKEQYILKERMEIFTDYPKTLQELGIKLDRTRERIRQLESEALKKLRKHLKNYSNI